MLTGTRVMTGMLDGLMSDYGTHYRGQPHEYAGKSLTARYRKPKCYYRLSYNVPGLIKIDTVQQ